jgi:hypothetical protein
LQIVPVQRGGGFRDHRCQCIAVEVVEVFEIKLKAGVAVQF